MKVIRIINIAIIIFALVNVTIYSKVPENYYEGVNYYLNGEMEKAFTFLEKAYNEQPSNKEIKGLLVEVIIIVAGKHYEKKEYEKSFEYISKAKKLSPNNAKVREVYKMLNEKLYPENIKIKNVVSDSNIFDDLVAKQKENIIKRKKIIKNPPQKLTVKEKELLRPIFIGYENEKRESPYLLIIIVVVFFLVVILITNQRMKQMMSMNIESIEHMHYADEKAEKLEKELEKLKREQSKNNSKIERKKDSQDLKLIEERLRRKYANINKNNSKAYRKLSRIVPEPEIVEPLVRNEKVEKEVKQAFRDLQKNDYNGSVNLLKKMTGNGNSWIRLWATELSDDVKISDSMEILKILILDNEYQVKKNSLKLLKSFLESKDINMRQKETIKEIIAMSHDDGWIV